MTTDTTATLVQASEKPSDTDQEAKGWRTAIASALGLTVGPSVLTVMSFGAFIAPLHREFGWSVSAIGRAASVLSITVMIISPLQGYLVDRYGGRRVILWSSPVFGLSLMAMYFLPGRLSVFYLAWALVPLCGLGLWPVSYLRLTAGWFERRLGLALGIANAGIGVGTVLVPLLTAWLIGAFGWRTAFLGLGAVALLAFPVAFFHLTEPTPRATQVRTGGDTLKVSAIRRPFWLILGAFLLLGLVGSSITVYQIPLLLDAGVPEHIADLLPVALGLALIVARIATGWLLDRFPASVVMSCNLAGGLVAVLLFAAGPNVATGIIAAALAGLLIGSEFDVLSFLVPRHFGRMAYGKIYGFAFSAFQIGGAVASSAVSASRESYGSYTPAMLTLAVVCVVCAALFLCLGPYRYDTAPGQATHRQERQATR
ncbi:MFS transporter [Streptomyces sp. SID11385]|uniref:MFS transporter n=1 Tax=Streptomyces sp. SID11385 TaxID=2706031 RepID=UPI0013C84DBC|nr:MFS transporter [Streptomyces sp. SID11385]NEA44029.1 MFS transporter [Streptomyces sp. SID11385]